MRGPTKGGATASRQPALVSDQAASRLDPTGFDQAQGPWTVEAAAEFLCARVRELESELADDSEVARQFYGHIIPALARMESTLAEARGGA